NDYGPVTAAIDLLREAGLGRKPVPGKKIVVIGGGNVAIDSARTALRLGCDDITVLYRRTRSEMPADEEEILQAGEEGIKFSFLTMPVEVLGSNGKISGLRCLKTRPGPEDGSGRRRPLPVDGSDYVIRADEVISAVGQRTNPEDLIALGKLTWSAHGTVKADSVSMTTSMDGVFAAGDLVTGPATVIEAVAGGKRAAKGIDRYLSGLPRLQMQDVPYRRSRQGVAVISARHKMNLQRPEMPLLDMDRRRRGFQQVELGYSEDLARREAARCLRCDICSRCGICVDVCRNQMGIDALMLGYLDSRDNGPTDFTLTSERCIGCGACAVNCPTGAMQIIDRGHERILSLCGTVMSRFPLEYCESCKTALQTAACRAYMDNRVKIADNQESCGSLCSACKREKAAGRIAERYFQSLGKEPTAGAVNDEWHHGPGPLFPGVCDEWLGNSRNG
ncbi:MAG: 4Fe-4S ferredoxin, partial [Deltaproteobacteria bacterium]